MAKQDTHDTKQETISLTIEQLRTLISEARGAVPEQPSLDEAFAKHQDMMREARARTHVAWYQAFVSRETGARCVAYITESRRHPGGRVISLPEYQYPEGSDRTVANGGTCAMANIVDANGKPTPEYRQWRYGFWKSDLRAYVGGDGGRLDAVGPARPSLEDAKTDLTENAVRVPEASKAPEIVARNP